EIAHLVHYGSPFAARNCSGACVGRSSTMRVGVTGGYGFIGRYVCEELITRGHEPLVFDSRGRTPNPDWEVMIGDIRDSTAMVELAAHCDGIIHLAAVLGTQETIRNPRPAAETNL